MEPWQLIVLLGIGFFIFIARIWLKSAIEKSASHIFDVRIEKVRADFREREELLRSAIRSRESDIAALRSAVLDGRSTRISWLEKRRLEALNNIWNAVIILAPYKAVAAIMATIKFDVAAKEAHRNPGLRKAVSVMTGAAPKELPQEASVSRERPYISPLLWAYFSAYQAILLGAYIRAKVIEIGMENPEKFLNLDHIKGLVVAVLPQTEKFLSENDAGASYYLVDQIEEAILNLVKEETKGIDLDEAELRRARDIMKAVADVTATDQAEADRIKTG